MGDDPLRGSVFETVKPTVRRQRRNRLCDSGRDPFRTRRSTNQAESAVVRRQLLRFVEAVDDEVAGQGGILVVHHHLVVVQPVG